MSRYTFREAVRSAHCRLYFEIVDTVQDTVVDTARNEARARLLVIRYNREAAKPADPYMDPDFDDRE